MSGFLYYKPNISSPFDLKEIEGLGDGLKMGGFVKTLGGPDGKGGLIFGIHGRSDQVKHVGYYPKEQDWQSFNNGEFWVSIPKGLNVDPKSLLKKDHLPGHFVELGDGNKWLCPIARKFHEGSQLPATIMINNAGEYKLVTVDRYLSLQKDADRVFGIFFDVSEFEELNMQEIYDISTRCLQVNYHISKYEISVLKLITTVNCLHIAKTLLDAQSAEEDEKKTDHIDETN